MYVLILRKRKAQTDVEAHGAWIEVATTRYSAAPRNAAHAAATAHAIRAR